MQFPYHCMGRIHWRDLGLLIDRRGQTMTAHEYADGLRQIADWYEEHPEIPVPHLDSVDIYTVRDRDDLRRVARALGHCEKGSASAESLFVLKRQFGALWLQFYWHREQVCTRRVVGVTEVAEQFIPAHTREIVEWDCESILQVNQEGTGEQT